MTVREPVFLALFIAAVVLACAHAASSCAHTQDVGRGAPPLRATTIASHPSSASPSHANTGFPPAGPRAVGAELVAIKSPGPAGSPEYALGSSAGDVEPEAGPSARRSAAGGSPAPLSPHAAADRPAGSAHARPGRAAEPAGSVLLARACWLESGWSLSDCAAIVYVLKARARRSGSTLQRTTLAYSALDADTPRAVFARQLPWGDEPTFSERENERWALVRWTARAALDGRVRNPAPGARHWGARNLASDVRRAQRAVQSGRWRSIESETRNAFYAVVGR